MNQRTTAASLLTLGTASVAASHSNSSTRPAEGSNAFNDPPHRTGSVISSAADRLVVKNEKGQETDLIITCKQVDASMFAAGDCVAASYVPIAGTGARTSKEDLQ